MYKNALAYLWRQTQKLSNYLALYQKIPIIYLQNGLAVNYTTKIKLNEVQVIL